MDEVEVYEAGYVQGRRDMLVVVRSVLDEARKRFKPDQIDIDVLLDGITLGLFEAEDYQND